MSYNVTYANEEWHGLVKGVEREVKAGQVWRRRNGIKDPFSSTLVLGIGEQKLSTDETLVWVRVARPYAYASCVGTTGPTVLTGAEVYEIEFHRLVTDFDLLTDNHYRT